MDQKQINKAAIRKTTEELHNIHKYLIEENGMTPKEAKEATKHYYRAFKRGFLAGAECAEQIIKHNYAQRTKKTIQ